MPRPCFVPNVFVQVEVAEKAELVRAFIWSEGRAHRASAPESLEMAFGVLRLKHDNVIKA